MARGFPELLTRVVAGEEIEITCGGVPVAIMAPRRIRLVDEARFRELLAEAPPVDDGFAVDVRAIRATAGPAENPQPP